MIAAAQPAYLRRRTAVRAAILASALTILLLPVVFVAISSFDYGQRAFVVFPPERPTLDAYRNIQPRYWAALWTSLQLAATTAAVALAIGVPAAIGLVRGAIPGKAAFLAMFRAPLQIPAVVAGVAFLQAYAALAAATGWHGAGTFAGLVAAHAFAATPYVIGTLTSVMQASDPGLEEAAQSLGATQWGTLRQVTLPLLRPGIFVGGLYAFMISFSEVPMSVFLSGSRLMTFPVEIFNSMQFDFEPSILAVSTLVTVGSLVVVWIAQRLAGIDLFVRRGKAE